MDKTHISSLPTTALQQVMAHLPIGDCVSASRVSKELKAAARDCPRDKDFWAQQDRASLPDARHRYAARRVRDGQPIGAAHCPEPRTLLRTDRSEIAPDKLRHVFLAQDRHNPEDVVAVSSTHHTLDVLDLPTMTSRRYAHRTELAACSGDIEGDCLVTGGMDTAVHWWSRANGDVLRHDSGHGPQQPIMYFANRPVQRTVLRGDWALATSDNGRHFLMNRLKGITHPPTFACLQDESNAEAQDFLQAASNATGESVENLRNTLTGDPERDAPTPRVYGQALLTWTSDGSILLRHRDTQETLHALDWPGKTLRDVRIADGKIFAIGVDKGGSYEHNLGQWTLGERPLTLRESAGEALQSFAHWFLG